MKPIVGINYSNQITDIPNGTVFDAANVTLADDGISLKRDNGFFEYSKDLNLPSIRAAFSCGERLLLFCYDDSVRTIDSITKTVKTCATGVTFYNNHIKAVYTYNSANELIIAFTEIDERDNHPDVPLRVINLDRPYKDAKLFNINAPIPITNVYYNYSDNAGSLLRKGSYDLFISYKISDNDYTDWRSIGTTLFISDIKEETITINHHKIQIGSGRQSVYSPTVKRDVTTDSEYANKQIVLTIDIDPTNKDLYEGFRIAYINNYNNTINSKIVDNYDINTTRVVLGSEYIETVSIDELTIENAYVYNVKAIENYGNRLYIANYDEGKKDEDVLLKPYVDKIYPVWKARPLGNKAVDTGKYNIEGGGSDSFETSTVSNSKSCFGNNKRISFVEYANKVYNLGIVNESIIILKYCGFRKVTVSSGSVVTEMEATNVNENYPIEAKFLWVYPDVTVVDKITLQKGTYISYIAEDTGDATNGKFVEYFVGKYTDQIFGLGLTPYVVKDLTYQSGEVLFSGDATHDDRLNKRTLDVDELYAFYVHYVDDSGRMTKGFRLTNYGKVNTHFDIVNLENPLNTFADFNAVRGYTNYLINIQNKDVDNNNPLYVYVNNAAYNRANKFGYFGYCKNSKNEVLYKSPTISTVANEFINTNAYCIIPDFQNIDIPTGYSGVTFSYEKVDPSVQFTAIACEKDFIGKETTAYKKARLHASEMTLFPSSIACNAISVYSSSTQLLTEYYGGSGRSTVTERSKRLSVMSKETISSKPIIINIDNVISSKIDIEAGREVCFTVDKVDNYPIKLEGVYSVVQIMNVSRDKYLSTNKQLIALGYIATKSRLNNKAYLPVDAANISLNLPCFHVIDSCYTFNKDGVIYTDGTGELNAVNADFKYWEDPIDTKVNEKGSPIRQVSYSKISRIYIPAEKFDNLQRSKATTTFELSGTATGTTKQTVESNYLKPEVVADAFKLDTAYILNPFKLLVNFDVNKKSITSFPRSIRRSNVIQTESLDTSWRIFRPDNYKPINEDKGVITNIAGVGYYLLVHCERSLFAFSKEATMQANNINIQLETPDTFDVDYQEMFTSNNGICGLQHYFMSIVADGAYYFFDNLAKTFYKWSSQGIDIISNDISALLTDNLPTYLKTGLSFKNNNTRTLGRCAYDTKNKRLLIQLPCTNSVSSYCCLFNYSTIVNKFVSYIDTKPIHSMTYDYDSVYIIDEPVSNKNVIWKSNNDSKIENAMLAQYFSYIDIVFNSDPTIDKVFKSIRYKSIKHNNSNQSTINNVGIFSSISVHTQTTSSKPMSLVKFSNDELDYLKAYKLPYFDGDYQNFNYIINSKNNSNINVINASPFNTRHTTNAKDLDPSVVNLSSNEDTLYDSATVHGSYFIVRLAFNNSTILQNVELLVDKYK